MRFEYIKMLIEIFIAKLQGYEGYVTNLKLPPKIIKKLKRKYRVIVEGEGFNRDIKIIWKYKK